uniref:Glucose-6-phosphate dehydrogenase C-terminal domain-containing protein n=1 Tax=Brassica campestris TaxID=3711 RepID=M4E908_BRACM
MGSGQWHVEKRSTLKKESFLKEYGAAVSESRSLSIIVLGASGDLAKKKTFPALFNLYHQRFLNPDEVHIFGYARTKSSDEELRDKIRRYLVDEKNASEKAEALSKFLQLIKYVSGPYDSEDGFKRLDKAISEHEISKKSSEGSSRRLFYLALPPSVYPPLVLRFANRFFLPLWNRDNIANVQIVFREDFGTEGRGGYFDEYGVVQVLCLVAMEKPISLKPEHIRDEKVKVLQSVIPIKDEEVVLGQYEGYRDDPTVPNDSNTPTFATTILRIDNERWEGVPFILKAGKAMGSKKADIRIQFKDVPGDIFKCQKQGRNEFVIRLQPSEAMYMKLTVKQPGLEMQTVQSELDLSYKQRYQDVSIPEAYERLILDTIKGDQQHFVRRDELKAAWEIFTPLLHRIEKGEVKSIPYKPGSRGPTEADQLLEKAGYLQTHGYMWIPPTL